MKILILANNDEGLYKFRKELIQKLLKKNNTVYTSLPDGKYVSKLSEMGCKFVDTEIDRRGINPKTDLKLLLFYRKIIKRVKPELVITYTIKPNIYGGLICCMFRIPYAVNITGLGTAFQRSGCIKTLVTFLYKIALKKAKVVFFENTENKNVMMDMRIVKEEQTCVLNGAGVNLEEYSYCEYPTEEETRFLFIGRVMKEKGVDELFEVAERIKSEYENVYFDIVGPMEDDYKDKINSLVKRGVIEYYGYQQDVKPFIEKCHCFVLPSWHEGMANTNLEAAAMGRPLITSRIHGCMEAVEDGVTGFLCERNADDLYRIMKKFIKLSSTQHKAMGIAGRKRMEEIFDKKKVIEVTYEELSK